MKESIETALEANSIYRIYQGGYFKTLVAPDETSGEMAVIEMVLPEGAEPPLHLHENEDETFYVLEGEMAFNIDGKDRLAQPGEAVYAPRKVPHSFKILSKQATFITVITPGKLWNYFIEFSAPATGELQVSPPMGPPPLELVAQLTSRMTATYGVTFL